MTTSNPLIFYDICSPKQPRSYAPNPSKTRLALSFKGVPFKTTFIDILDIAPTRQSLNCAATRKLDDGSDFFTLPIVQDPTSGKVVGDSFDIAVWLDDTFPDSGGGLLFPADNSNSTTTTTTTTTTTPPTPLWQTYESPNKDTPFFAPLTTHPSSIGAKTEPYARFNTHIDATFSANMGLYGWYLPFNPATAKDVKALMCKRAHLRDWDDIFVPQGEGRDALRVQFKEALGSLAAVFAVGEGLFLEGPRATYADLILGGWLNMLSTIMPEGEWEEFKGWYGGVFGRLHDALQERYFVCT